MATTTRTVTENYEVADIELADWGRKELDMAEVEMPGLMEARSGRDSDQSVETERSSEGCASPRVSVSLPSPARHTAPAGLI